MASHKRQIAQGPGRNEPCRCGSQRKYKHCCEGADRAAEVERELGQAELRRGLTLERQGRTEEAISAYTAAAAFIAAAPEARSRIGHLFLSLGRAKEAVGSFKAAASSAPDDPARRMDLVRALTIEKKDAEAEAEVRAALAADPENGDGYWLLGRILAEAGRFDDARAAFERSVALAPNQGVIYYDLVRSYRLTQADQPLIDRMLVLARSAGDTDQRVRLHFALGKAFDDLGDYGAAMKYFAKANQIKKAMSAFDRAGFSRRVDVLIEQFTPEYLALCAASGGLSDLPVMVLGMPRSGTTLVEQILSSHRDIEGAGELQFWPAHGAAFERLAAAAQVSDFRVATEKAFLSVLRNISPSARRIVDKTPFNFLWAGLIYTIFPRATIIHCRRNPLDTCVSIHSTYFSPRPDFSTDRGDLAFYYQQYARLMDHWRAVLPAERFVEVEYEALVSNPETHSRRLIAACGLDWDDACLRPERNVRFVRTPSKWQARQPISGDSVGRWRRYQDWLGPLSELSSGV